MLIAQLSDLHIRPRGKAAYRVVETNMLLTRAVETLLAMAPRPDAVLITGDLTDCGRPDEYAELAAILARLSMPVYLVPGNHDRRENLKAGFKHYDYLETGSPLVDYAVDLGPLTLVGLDSVVPGHGHGTLAAESLAFLDAALGRQRKPTIVMLHHPPFLCGIGHMDAIRLTNAAALAGIVARHPHVTRILCGHHHRPIQAMFAGTLAMVAPSVAHQVVLDLEEGAPSGFNFEPPAFLLHLWTEDGLVTHQAYVEKAPGPFPFLTEPDYPGKLP